MRLSSSALALAALLVGCGSNSSSTSAATSGSGASGPGGTGAAGGTGGVAGGGAGGSGGSGATGGGGSGGGTGGSMLCGDPEAYMPAWAAQAKPDKEIYISPDGNDGNDGSEASPLKTPAAAVKKLAPGVRLNFKTGTYGCGMFLQDFAGTRDKPGIIRSVDGPRKAKFVCAANEAGIYISKGSGVIVDGIELSGGAGHAIQMDSGSPFDKNALSHDLVVHASYIHDPACAPIKIAQSQFVWVIGNEFAHPGTCGAGGGGLRQNVEFVAVDDTVVVGNEGHDAQLFNEVKGGARRALIALNRIHDSANGILVGGDATGFQFLVDQSVDFEASQVLVWGNTISLPGAGSEAFRIVACHDCLVANNTFYSDTPKALLRILSSSFGPGMDTHNKNVRITNNVFSMASKASLYPVASNEMPDVVTFSHNLWFAADGAFKGAFADIPWSGDAASLFDVDPQLTAPPTDLTPKSGSPVIGAGVPLPEVPASAKGNCWSGNPDIGAY
jgi:hypothetical protein